MNKKKIGIVTITGEANYGNRLQNYAMDHILKAWGADVYTFYEPIKRPFSLKRWAKRTIKFVFGLRDGYMLRRIRKFTQLDKKCLQLADYRSASDFDYVLLGSDQIWNPNFRIIRQALDFFFGTFVEPEKRVAYAAGIGADHIPAELQDAYMQRLQALKAISVREEQGAQIVRELTGRIVPVMVDPTMLLTTQDWSTLEKKIRYQVADRFLLTYFLGEVSPERQAYIQGIVNRYGLQWVQLENDLVSRPNNVAYYMTTPDEFIWLVHHCQLMLTDSFHGSVFSILFDKPFRCFGREESGVADMSSRMDTLFGKFGIGDWCRGSVQEDPDHIFYKDYASVPAVLERERQFALDYLKNALEIHE